MANNNTNNAEFWKRKLAAYLHDPPSKALDIKTHGERSDAAFRAAGFADAEIGSYFAHADHTGAAIDRIPFPKSAAANISCVFDGVRNAFVHPLGSKDHKQPIRHPFHQEFASAELGIEGEQAVQPVLSAKSLADLPDEAARWRARFFAHWRLWRKHAVEHDYRLGMLPADTRLPDHSIWTHMQVVSALAGCVQEDENHKLVWHPAFLKFQLGPVQEFIAQARSIRDLWSGSYLLSWLMAAGLKRLSELAGPDAVIYPNLQGQPLFDLWWRDDLWKKVTIGDGSRNVWQSLGHKDVDLLTPNLPNVFLAVVPAKHAADYGERVVEAVKTEWRKIAKSAWDFCEQAGLTADEGGISRQERKERFDRQVEQFLSLSWQVTPWPAKLEDALKLADGFANEMPVQQARKRVNAIVEMATKFMPKAHRDGRFYVGGDNGPKNELNNIGLGWSVILALNGWQLDAVRQTRCFDATNQGRWKVGTFCNKDALNGRDEAVAGGRQWFGKAEKAGEPWNYLFKHDDWLGAAMLIKRVWHLAYLKAKYGLKTDGQFFPMPNTRGISAHEPFSNADDEKPVEQIPSSEKYFAVLALDGDQIGKWISGEKTPPFATQLADYWDASHTVRQGVLGYFEKFDQFLKTNRPLSASYHLQFSETLSNFALFCVRPIVEAFDGCLIYAGGDDVVALLPADTALACAQALRMAFQGQPGLKEFLQANASALLNRHPESKAPYYQKLAANAVLLDCNVPGFLCRLDIVDNNNRPIPFLVPGPATDCSVGIAVAHFKSPLQDVVRAAQAAEKRAKRRLNRSAVAVTLMKRSGETIEWGCKWDSGGLFAYEAMCRAMANDVVSSKFPHRIVELVEKYQTGEASEKKLGAIEPHEEFQKKVDLVLEKEVAIAAGRQRGPKYNPDEANQIQKSIRDYLRSIQDSQKKIDALIGLCQTVAFTHRISEE